MLNPTRKLYRLLAESLHYTSQVRELHKSMAARIPQQVQQLQGELERLRKYLFRVGVGVDQAAEDRYLEILQELRRLQQIYQHGQRLPDPLPPLAEDLRKALDYGQLLLEVYGSGRSLAKAARADLAAHARYLQQYAHPQAQALAQQLRSLAHAHC